jgi:hypothetical protein
MRSCSFGWALALLVPLALGPRANAEAITSLTGLEGIGAFTGTFTYTPASATSATLVVQLTNTSAVGGGGFLTALAFNNPGGHITGVSFSSSDPDFGLLGGSSFSNGVSAGPYGQLDIGASTGGSFEGGGSPSQGLGFGATGTFTFNLTGTGLDGLTASSFFSAYSVPPGAGQGVQAFVARFRGFTSDGAGNATSDKVRGVLGTPLNPAEINPEPGSLILAAVGGVGTGILWLRRRARR